tara:strand:+ start:351 stop:620 length:270 start_codon:yes stop_codon:yes gene_type:complete
MLTLSRCEQLHVHCRTGSLEKKELDQLLAVKVHCRTGSLETDIATFEAQAQGSLPHRQLRNSINITLAPLGRSLPHRQLRKDTDGLGDF